MKTKVEGMENVVGNRGMLVKAMEDLRKEGLIARSNFMCCQTCAGYDIAQKVSDMTTEEAGKVNGCVYWHRQDEDDLRERGALYLAYGPLETTRHGTIGLPTEVVGRMVVKALEARGLTVKWNGNGNDRIWVDLTKPNKNGDGEKEGEPEKRKSKMVLKITDMWDGNAFAVLGNTKEALEAAGVEKAKIDEAMEKAKSGDYNHLLATCVKALEEGGYTVV
jgi:hypothetical protein